MNKKTKLHLVSDNIRVDVVLCREGTQGLQSWPIDNASIGGKAGAVAGAVPGLFSAVPLEFTAKVGAGYIDEMQFTLFIPVGANFGSFAGNDLPPGTSPSAGQFSATSSWPHRH